MTSLNRMLKMGPKRFLQKAFFYDEIYTIALKKKGTDEKFMPVPNAPDTWMADPLITTWNGKDYLFVEVFDQSLHRGHISYSELSDWPLQFHTVLAEDYHMSFPMIFTWNDQFYMIPETSENHSINLYRANQMPDQWELVCSFKTEGLLVDSVLLSKSENQFNLIASESDPENGLLCRFVKYSIQKTMEDYQLIFDDEFNSKNKEFNYFDRCAGPLLKDAILPTQVSTELDYGVSVQFKELKDSKIVKVIDRTDIQIEGIPEKRIIGIHTWSEGKYYDAIDARYLKPDILLNVHRLERRAKKKAFLRQNDEYSN